MEQEQSRPKSKGAPDDSLERLDSLSGPLAERIMRRAIELQSEDDYGTEKITLTHLEKIAVEIGVEPQHLKSALQEELDPRLTTTTGLLDKIFIPHRLTAGIVIHADRHQVEQQVIEWLRSSEGFMPTRVSPDGYQWKRDDRLGAKLRAGLRTTGSESGLRSMKWLTHRQTDMAGGSQLVELDVDSTMVRYTALGVGGGLAALGVVGAVLSAVNGLGATTVSSFFGPLIPASILGLGVGILIAKTWGRGLRDSLTSALHGISSPELAKYRRGHGRNLLSKAVDNVEASLDQLFKDL